MKRCESRAAALSPTVILQNIVTLQNSTTIDVDFTGSINGNTITLNPDNPLPDGTYIITLPGNTVEDVGGNVISDAQTASFTVDATAPTATFTPANSTTVTDNATDITLVFDEPVRKAGGSPITKRPHPRNPHKEREQHRPRNTSNHKHSTPIPTPSPSTPPPTSPTAPTPSPFLPAPLKMSVETLFLALKQHHSLSTPFCPRSRSLPKTVTRSTDKTTDITLAFGEAVRKAGGSPITDGDIANIVTLQNSTTIGVDFTGSISGNTITLNPSADLSPTIPTRLRLLQIPLKTLKALSCLRNPLHSR